MLTKTLNCESFFLFEPAVMILHGAQLDKTKMEQIFLLFQCSLLSWKGCLSFINCTVSPVSQSQCTVRAWWRQASSHLRQHWRQLRLSWPGLASIHREEGGRREAILIIMSTWNLQEQQSEETLWAALSAITRYCLSFIIYLENIGPFHLQLWFHALTCSLDSLNRYF